MDKGKKQETKSTTPPIIILPCDRIDPELYLFRRNKRPLQELLHFLEDEELSNIKSTPGIYISEMLCYLMGDDFYNLNHCLKRAVEVEQVKEYRQIYVQVFKVGSCMFNHFDDRTILQANMLFGKIEEHCNESMKKLFEEFIRYNQIRLAIFYITGYQRFSESKIIIQMHLENFQVFIQFCQEYLPNFKSSDIFQKQEQDNKGDAKSPPTYWISVNREKAQAFLNKYSPSIVLPSLENLEKMTEIIKFIETDGKALVDVANRTSKEVKMMTGSGSNVDEGIESMFRNNFRMGVY